MSRIEAILAEMTLAEKIGQMTQASNEAITPEEVTQLHIGSVLSGGNGNPTPNTPQVWVDMVSAFARAALETRLGIPLIYGIDAVHGHGNVHGATIFPHNIGLGAAGDPELVQRIGMATRTEMLATGIHWAFAPTIAVPHDIRWGRTYEGFGRDPELVAEIGAAAIRGLQGNAPDRLEVLACAKHFVGDGATTWGTAPRFDWVDWWDGWGDTWQIDQGDARISEGELRATHLAPYRAAVDAGVATVMASYNSWNGDRLHGNRYMLTDVLKGELGFDGFVISDWMGVDQLDSSYERGVVDSINAGIDMVMVPNEFRRFIDVMVDAVTSGAIPMERIDDAVRRILGAKHAVGLFEQDRELPPLDVIGCAEHRAIAAEAARRSAVLLKNSGALPLAASEGPLLVSGAAADDIGLPCGGWTVGWQGGTGRTTSGSTLLDGLRSVLGSDVLFDPAGDFNTEPHAKVGVACIAEPPYAEGPGDSATISARDEDRAVFDRMRERCDSLVLVVYSGRPLAISDLIERADAVVAAWLPGSEAGALGALLAGIYDFQGATPQPWPQSIEHLDDQSASPLYPKGHGLMLASDDYSEAGTTVSPTRRFT